LGVTVVDVAKAAGYSAMTVSRALNRPDSLPAATVAKVREAAAALGYVRNRTAASLRSSKSHLVAALTPTLTGRVFVDAIAALTQGLTDRGYHLILGQSGYEGTSGDELLEDIISRRPDGVVVVGTMQSPRGRQLLQASDIPTLEFWELTKNPIDMLIGFSHEAVGLKVADFLAARGRKHLAYLGADDRRSVVRFHAFRKRLKRLGLPEPRAEFVPAPATLGSGRRSLGRLLDAGVELDGVFCSSDTIAAGVFYEASSRRIKVPRDLAVMGFGDLSFAQDVDPPLTSVRVDGAGMGALAAETLVRKMLGEKVEKPVVDVGFEIVIRKSA
jgi:LacI family transcriptional regulator, gluconate utilization system Gnt-I transcriptional repressor